MKTNIGIETTDEERGQIGKTLGIKGMVSRKELTAAVQEFVQELISGKQTQEAKAPTNPPPARVGTDASGFKPSRGDEPYIYKPKSVTLKDKCSEMLDLAEEIERLTWEVLEQNRAET